LLVCGLADEAQLGGVFGRHQAVVSDQGHALVGHAVALHVHLVVFVSSHANGDELGAKLGLVDEVGVLVLEVTGRDALLRRQEVCVDPTQILHLKQTKPAFT